MLKKLLLLLMSVFGLGTLGLVVWYQIDGIPTELTEEYMNDNEHYSVSERSDSSLLFSPSAPIGSGIVIMHGALIKPQSYARSAAFFASQGYTVYLPYGPGRLSIAAIESTAQFIESSAMEQWFFIGHSMGGMASLEVITNYELPVAGLALWATAMPKDYSHADIPVLFIWGDTDGLLPQERFEKAQNNLPAATHYLTLEGANHKNFSLYSHQFFDNDAKIDWLEQIDFANKTTSEFFSKQLN